MQLYLLNVNHFQTSNEEESTLLSPNSATNTPSQDTSDRNTPDLSNRANSSSGASTPFNPLLAAGLIPKSFLQAPVCKEKKISRRINTKASVITGEEYVEEIRKKEEEIQKIEQEKQRRKRKREEKRAAK